MANTISSEQMAKELYETAKKMIAIDEEGAAAKLLAAAEIYSQMADDEAEGE